MWKPKNLSKDKPPKINRHNYGHPQLKFSAGFSDTHSSHKKPKLQKSLANLYVGYFRNTRLFKPPTSDYRSQTYTNKKKIQQKLHRRTFSWLSLTIEIELRKKKLQNTRSKATERVFAGRTFQSTDPECPDAILESPDLALHSCPRPGLHFRLHRSMH